MEGITINYLSKNEADFVKWFGDNTFDDYWETNGKMLLHHYIFTKEGKQFHISFSKVSIVCSLITNFKKGRERDIYKGYNLQVCVGAICSTIKRA